MWRFLALLLERYGLVAFGIGVNVFCFWKLFTNHLAHISKEINENTQELKSVGKKVNKLSNRVSKIEGKLDK